MADFTALRGIVCPVVSPCTSNEGVDYDSLQENLARLLRAPITGFYVCGGTGDGSRLTFAERCRTAELTIAQTRAAGRRTIVHVGQTLQRHALELAEHAMTLGADAVASVPPQGAPPADGLDLYAIYRPAPDDADEGGPNENENGGE